MTGEAAARQRPIVVAGELMLDVLFAAPGGLYVRPGGSAATVALALARGAGGFAGDGRRAAGRRVRVLGLTGPDPNGAWVRQKLAEAGVGLPLEPATAAATGYVILHRRSGREAGASGEPAGPARATGFDRVAYVERGANRLLDPDQAAAGLEGLFAPPARAWLHISGYALLEPGPAGAVRHLAALARAAGVPVSLDPGVPHAYRAAGAERLLDVFRLGVAEGPDYFLPSAGMALHLTGAPDTRAASERLARLFRAAVVKDGAAGAWLDGLNIELGDRNAVPGADPSGAGDVFDAAFIDAVLGGAPLPEAVGRANAEAAAYVRAGLAGWHRVATQEPPVLISACLFGTAAAYDAQPKAQPGAGLSPVKRLHLPVCPEQLGGLGTPRPPAEIAGGAGGEAVIRGEAAVLDSSGRDVTPAFLKGARRAVELARATGAGMAVLKEGSPSCGTSFIHDGTFQGCRIPGRGVAAAALAALGVDLRSEETKAQAG